MKLANGLTLVFLFFIHAISAQQNLYPLKVMNRQTQEYIFVNRNGKQMIPEYFEDAINFRDDRLNYPKLSTAVAKTIGNKFYYGFINMEGEETLPFKYGKVEAVKNGYLVYPKFIHTHADSIAIVDKFGVFRSDFIYTTKDYIAKYNDQTITIPLILNGKWGGVDAEGKILVPFIYDDLKLMNETFMVYRRDSVCDIYSATGILLQTHEDTYLLDVNSWGA
jgi:hypothetical protein